MTAPGVGPATAVRFVAALDHISRFTGAHSVESYLGLVPGMAKGLAQNLVYYARLLKAHPQTFVAGHATCCEMHAGLEAPA